jgi:hypothetical protein
MGASFLRDQVADGPVTREEPRRAGTLRPCATAYDAAVYRLRCTARLLKRLPLDEPDYESRPGGTTTRLGDWYATLHTQHHRPWVLAVSERTLLPILIPLAPGHNLPLRLILALSDMLRALGVLEPDILRETGAMSDGFALGPTNSRSVVGALTQFSSDLRYMWALDPARPAESMARHLSESPMKPIGYESPTRMTIEAFGASLQSWRVH